TQRLFAQLLGQQIGPSDQTFKGKVLDGTLSVVEKDLPKVSIETLKTALRNQARIVTEAGKELMIKYGLHSKPQYNPQDPVHRAVLAMEESFILTDFRATGTFDVVDPITGVLISQELRLTKSVEEVIADLQTFAKLVTRPDLFSDLAALYGLGAAYQGKDRDDRATIQTIVELIGVGRPFKDVETFRVLLRKAVTLLPEIQRKLIASTGHPLVLGHRHSGFGFRIRGGQLFLDYYDRFDRQLATGFTVHTLPKISVALVREDRQPDYQTTEFDAVDIANNFNTVSGLSILTHADEARGEVFRTVYRFYGQEDAPIWDERNTYDLLTGRLKEQRRGGLVTTFRYGEGTSLEREGVYSFWNEFDPTTYGPSFLQIPLGGETREEATGRLISDFDMEGTIDLMQHRIVRRVQYYANGDRSSLFKSVEEALDIRTGAPVQQRVTALDQTVAEITYAYDAKEGGDFFLGLASTASTVVNGELLRVSRLGREAGGKPQVDTKGKTLGMTTQYYLDGDTAQVFKEFDETLDLFTGSVLRQIFATRGAGLAPEDFAVAAITYEHDRAGGGDRFLGLASKTTLTVDGQLVNTSTLNRVDLAQRTLLMTTVFYLNGDAAAIFKTVEEELDIVSGSVHRQRLTAGDGTHAQVRFDYSPAGGGNIFLGLAARSTTTVEDQVIKQSLLDRARVDLREQTLTVHTTYYHGDMNQPLKELDETLHYLSGSVTAQTVRVPIGQGEEPMIATVTYDYHRLSGGSLFLGLASQSTTRANGQLLKISQLNGVTLAERLIDVTTTFYLDGDARKVFKTIGESLDIVSGAIRRQHLVAGDGTEADVRYEHLRASGGQIFLGLASRSVTTVDGALVKASSLQGVHIVKDAAGRVVEAALRMTTTSYLHGDERQALKTLDEELDVVSGSVRRQVLHVPGGGAVRVAIDYAYRRGDGGHLLLGLASTATTTVNDELLKTSQLAGVNLRERTVAMTTTFYWNGDPSAVFKVIQEEFDIVSGSTRFQHLTAGDGTPADVRLDYDRAAGFNIFLGVATQTTTTVDGQLAKSSALTGVDLALRTLRVRTTSYLNGDSRQIVHAVDESLDLFFGSVRAQTITAPDGTSAELTYEHLRAFGGNLFLGVASRVETRVDHQLIKTAVLNGVDLRRRVVEMTTTYFFHGDPAQVFRTLRDELDIVSGSARRQHITIADEDEPVRLLVEHEYARALGGNIFIGLAGKSRTYEFDPRAEGQRGVLLAVASLQRHAAGQVATHDLSTASRATTRFGVLYTVENMITKLQFQELRDGLGNLAAKWIGAADAAHGAFVPEAIEISHYEGILQWFGIAVRGFTYADDRTKRLADYHAPDALLSSRLIDTNRDGRIDASDFVGLHVPLWFTNHATTLEWRELRDYAGRIRAKIDFDEDGVEQTIDIPRYRGILGVLGIAVESHLYLYVPGQALRAYDPFASVDFGGPVISGALINEAGHRPAGTATAAQLGFVRPDGSVLFRYENHYTKLIYEELRDNRGRVTAKVMGRRVNGSFRRRMIELSTYRGILGVLGMGVEGKLYVFNQALGLATDVYLQHDTPFITARLVDAQGDPVEGLRAINRQDGSVIYHYTHHLTKLHWQEVRDKWGKVTIRYAGYLERGRFVREKAAYLNYAGRTPDGQPFAVHQIARFGQVYVLDRAGRHRDSSPFKLAWFVKIDRATGDMTNQIANLKTKETWREVMDHTARFNRKFYTYEEQTNELILLEHYLTGLSVGQTWETLRTPWMAGALRQAIETAFVPRLEAEIVYDDDSGFGRYNISDREETYLLHYRGVPRRLSSRSDIEGIDGRSGDLSYHLTNLFTEEVARVTKSNIGLVVQQESGYQDPVRGFVAFKRLRAAYERDTNYGPYEIADRSITYRLQELTGDLLFKTSESMTIDVNVEGRVTALERLWTQTADSATPVTERRNIYKQLGSRRQIIDEVTQDESQVWFDPWGFERFGTVAETGDYDNLIADDGTLGVTRNHVVRETATVLDEGISGNPYLPDLPDKYWKVKHVVHYDPKGYDARRPGQIWYWSEQWIDRYGNKVVEVTTMPSETPDGQPKQHVAYLFPRDDQLPWVETPATTADRPLPLGVAAPLSVGARWDVSTTPFIGFYLDHAQVRDALGRHAALEIVVTATDARGGPQTAVLTENDLFRPYPGNTLWLRNPGDVGPSAGFSPVMTSDWLQDDTVKLLSVKELARGDASKKRPALNVSAITGVSIRYKPLTGTQVFGTMRTSGVFRLEAPHGALHPDAKVLVAEGLDYTGARVDVDSRGWVIVTGRVRLTPAAKEQLIKPLRWQKVFDPAGRLRVTTLTFEIDQTGTNHKDGMLEHSIRIIYDRAGRFPLISVEGETGRRPAIVMVREDSQRIVVAMQNPGNRLWEEHAYDPTALNDGTEDWILLGGKPGVHPGLVFLPELKRELSNTFYRLYNRTLYYLAVRSWRGERLGIERGEPIPLPAVEASRLERALRAAKAEPPRIDARRFEEAETFGIAQLTPQEIQRHTQGGTQAVMRWVGRELDRLERLYEGEVLLARSHPGSKDDLYRVALIRDNAKRILLYVATGKATEALDRLQAMIDLLYEPRFSRYRNDDGLPYDQYDAETGRTRGNRDNQINVPSGAELTMALLNYYFATSHNAPISTHLDPTTGLVTGRRVPQPLVDVAQGLVLRMIAKFGDFDPHTGLLRGFWSNRERPWNVRERDAFELADQLLMERTLTMLVEAGRQTGADPLILKGLEDALHGLRQFVKTRFIGPDGSLRALVVRTPDSTQPGGYADDAVHEGTFDNYLMMLDEPDTLRARYGLDPDALFAMAKARFKLRLDDQDGFDVSLMAREPAIFLDRLPQFARAANAMRTYHRTRPDQARFYALQAALYGKAFEELWQTLGGDVNHVVPQAVMQARDGKLAWHEKINTLGARTPEGPDYLGSLSPSLERLFKEADLNPRLPYTGQRQAPGVVTTGVAPVMLVKWGTVMLLAALLLFALTATVAAGLITRRRGRQQPITRKGAGITGITGFLIGLALVPVGVVFSTPLMVAGGYSLGMAALSSVLYRAFRKAQAATGVNRAAPIAETQGGRVNYSVAYDKLGRFPKLLVDLHEHTHVATRRLHLPHALSEFLAYAFPWIGLSKLLRSNWEEGSRKQKAGSRERGAAEQPPTSFFLLPPSKTVSLHAVSHAAPFVLTGGVPLIDLANLIPEAVYDAIGLDLIQGAERAIGLAHWLIDFAEQHPIWWSGTWMTQGGMLVGAFLLVAMALMLARTIGTRVSQQRAMPYTAQPLPVRMLLRALRGLRHVGVNTTFTGIVGLGAYLLYMAADTMTIWWGVRVTWAIFAAYPVVILLSAIVWGRIIWPLWRGVVPITRGQKAWRAFWRDARRGGRLPPAFRAWGGLYDNQTALDMHRRYSERVLGSARRRLQLQPGGAPPALIDDPNGRMVFVRGDLETPFLTSGIHFYVLIGAWLQRLNPGIDLATSNNPWLVNADSLVRAVGRYLAEELTRGLPSDSKYPLQGQFDAQVWAQTEAIFKQYRDRLRRALDLDDRSGNLAGGHFVRILGELGLNDSPANPYRQIEGFNDPHRNHLAADQVRNGLISRHIQRERLDRVHPFLIYWARRLPQFALGAIGLSLMNFVQPEAGHGPLSFLVTDFLPGLGDPFTQALMAVMALGMLYTLVSEANRLSRFAPAHAVLRARAVFPATLFFMLVSLAPVWTLGGSTLIWLILTALVGGEAVTLA
ncbi:MAG: hypothetical protein Q8R78_02330, partial [Candidatus Omnitrophota bacterium]|nr:hypothetical protein [Candidatus Omnitrophota bacterium]